MKNYYFIEDYINPDKSPAEMSLIWILCVLLIVGLPFSIATWTMVGDSDPAHAERFGIFVGLWAPTLMAMANHFKGD